METSGFADSHFDLTAAEPLNVSSGTSQCYRVKLYGKLHFLKCLKPECRSNARYVAAMRKEFETGYKLDHPHLVRYMASGDDYLLTEWIDGLTLREFAQVNPAFFKNRDSVARLVGELLNVVEYLHSHQIVHLDLKPDNILITRVGNELKLTDLGFCYTDTFADTMGRTDSFAAPEQLDGSGNIDQRTDIFAIGKILATLPCANRYSKVIKRSTKPRAEDRYQCIDELRVALAGNHKIKSWKIALPVAMLALVAYTTWQLLKTDSLQEDVTPPVADSVVAASTASTLENDSVEPTAVPVDGYDKTKIEAPIAGETQKETEKTATTSVEESSHLTPITSSATVQQALGDTPAPVKKEISLSTLRDEMMALARPCYNRYLKPYESYRFSEIKDQYSTILDKCYDAFTPTLIDLWDTKYKNYSNLTRRQYFEEISEIRKSFDQQFYNKLMINDANSGDDN